MQRSSCSRLRRSTSPKVVMVLTSSRSLFPIVRPRERRRRRLDGSTAACRSRAGNSLARQAAGLPLLRAGFETCLPERLERDHFGGALLDLLADFLTPQASRAAERSP